MKFYFMSFLAGLPNKFTGMVPEISDAPTHYIIDPAAHKSSIITSVTMHTAYRKNSFRHNL